MTIKKKSTYTEAEVIAMMRYEQGASTLRDFAKELDVSFTYLSDVYNGRRGPGQKILDYFGMTKTRRVIIEYMHKK